MKEPNNEPTTATDPVIAEITHLGELQILTTTDLAELCTRVQIIEDALAFVAAASPKVNPRKSTKVEHKHIWATGGDDDNERVPLAVLEGHSVYFDCGPGGVILVSIEEDSLDLYGEMGNLSVRPVADAEVRVTVV